VRRSLFPLPQGGGLRRVCLSSIWGQLIPAVATTTRRKKYRRKTYPRRLRRNYIDRHPALVTEGCLYSIFRCGAGSGGRGTTPLSVGDAARGPGGPNRMVPARNATRHRAVMVGADGPSQASGTGRNPQRWIGRPDNRKREKGRLKGQSTGGHAEQAYKHRARDALGLGGLAFARRHDAGGNRTFDMPRCREASRPAGPSTFSLRTLRKLECAPDPWRPARPRPVAPKRTRGGGFGNMAYPGPAKEYGRWCLAV